MEDELITRLHKEQTAPAASVSSLNLALNCDADWISRLETSLMPAQLRIGIIYLRLHESSVITLL